MDAFKNITCALLLAISFVVCASPKLAPAQDKRIRPVILVTFTGRLNHGVLAVGGETTGTEISADKITWELDFRSNKKVRALANQWNRQTVIATGKLERRKGLEVSERWIVLVDKLEKPKKPKAPHTVHVDVIGKFRTGIFAVGGETTGTEILSTNIKWEVKPGKDHGNALRILNGKLGRLQGTLTRKKAVELDRDRWIVEAKKIFPLPTRR